MRRLLGQGGHLFQDPLWLIRVLLFVCLLGLTYPVGANWLGVLSDVGTFGAAIAAFMAIRVAHTERLAREKNEDEIRRPYLRIFDVKNDVVADRDGIRFVNPKVTAINLGRHSIFISKLYSKKKGDTEPMFLEDLKQLVASGSEVVFTVNLFAMQADWKQDGTEGHLLFYFNNVATGEQLYYLEVPAILDSKDHSASIRLFKGRQNVVGPVSDPYDFPDIVML